MLRATSSRGSTPSCSATFGSGVSTSTVCHSSCTALVSAATDARSGARGTKYFESLRSVVSAASRGHFLALRKSSSATGAPKRAATSASVSSPAERYSSYAAAIQPTFGGPAAFRFPPLSSGSGGLTMTAPTRTNPIRS